MLLHSHSTECSRNYPLPSHHAALVSARWLVWILRLLNLTDHQLECLGNILVVASRSFSPSTLVLFCKRLSVLCCDLALLWTQIALVADDDYRNPIRSLHKLRKACPNKED